MLDPSDSRISVAIIFQGRLYGLTRDTFHNYTRQVSWNLKFTNWWKVNWVNADGHINHEKESQLTWLLKSAFSSMGPKRHFKVQTGPRNRSDMITVVWHHWMLYHNDENSYAIDELPRTKRKNNSVGQHRMPRLREQHASANSPHQVTSDLWTFRTGLS